MRSKHARPRPHQLAQSPTQHIPNGANARIDIQQVQIIWVNCLWQSKKEERKDTMTVHRKTVSSVKSKHKPPVKGNPQVARNKFFAVFVSVSIIRGWTGSDRCEFTAQ
jgi:hypothetical protein